MNELQLNLNNRKLWAIIPAAGSGNRFSKTQLKQYQTIQEKTVIEHTVHRLNELPRTAYVLAIAENDDFAQTLKFENPEKAMYCHGGQERVNSVLNALNFLTDFADPNDLVFVHDAARPCVSTENLIELVQTAINENCSAILATPVRDTLKRVPKLINSEDKNRIETTVSRDELWQAQTPQISTIGLLKSSIEQALKDQITITDEASALEHMGEKVKVVMGRSDNIKITYPEDLDLARLIIQSQNI